MGRVSHVRIDTSMSTVSTPTVLRGSVHLDVGEYERLRVDAVELGIAFGVLEEVEQKVTGLLGPSAVGELMLLTLRGTRDSSSVDTERNSVLVVKHITKVLLGLEQIHTADS